jgi:hypothetical protein
MSVQKMSKDSVVNALLCKDNMRNNASPKLVEALERTYRNLSDSRLEDLYWYCYHEEVELPRKRQ